MLTFGGRYPGSFHDNGNIVPLYECLDVWFVDWSRATVRDFMLALYPGETPLSVCPEPYGVANLVIRPIVELEAISKDGRVICRNMNLANKLYIPIGNQMKSVGSIPFWGMLDLSVHVDSTIGVFTNDRPFADFFQEKNVVSPITVKEAIKTFRDAVVLAQTMLTPPEPKKILRENFE